MGNISKFYDGEKEDDKKPSESKEEHYTTDAEHRTQDCSGTDFLLLSSNFAVFVPNQHHNDPDKDKEVEEHHGEYGSEKSTPEYFRVRDEATVIDMQSSCNIGSQWYNSENQIHSGVA